jgi:hypothetical protein
VFLAATAVFKPDTWMGDNFSWLQKRTLGNICIAGYSQSIIFSVLAMKLFRYKGSHDAGMYILTDGTALANECNTLTQSNKVFQQLMFGMRYFDVRPVIGPQGEYWEGHYSQLSNITWQGTLSP